MTVLCVWGFLYLHLVLQNAALYCPLLVVLPETKSMWGEEGAICAIISCLFVNIRCKIKRNHLNLKAKVVSCWLFVLGKSSEDSGCFAADILSKIALGVLA